MVTDDFDTVINDLLEDNGAVDSYSIQNETASVIVHSRAGRNAKDSVLVEPVLNDLDASYHGCSNGWERYTIHNQQPASIQERDELYRLAQDYRQEATTAGRDTPSFGDWLTDQQ